MRLPTLAIGLAMLSPICAQAQVAGDRLTPQAPADADSLSAALFLNRAPPVAAPAVRARGDQASAAFGETFVTPDSIGAGLTGQPVVGGRVAAAGEGLMAWRSSETSRAVGGGAVDSVRLSVAGISRTPSMRQPAYDPTAVDVTFIRAWPGAMVVQAGPVGMSVSPHAGFGMDSNGGNRAEAGAMVRFSSAKTAVEDRLNAMGVKSGSTTYGDQGRWYVFAAVRGQSVGLNMLSGANGALRQAGWSTDASGALVGDGQLGLGWRQGGMEASLGYVHRGVKIRNAPYGASDSFSESLAAMSLTFHPRW